jgi:hypothetical protein
LQETREKERGEGGATNFRSEEGGKKKKKKQQQQQQEEEIDGGKRRRRRKLIGELCGSFKGFQ